MGESPQAMYLAEQADARWTHKREHYKKKLEMLQEINLKIGLEYCSRDLDIIDKEINHHLAMVRELLYLVTR